MREDKNSRVAIEVMGGHNLITINGEVFKYVDVQRHKLSAIYTSGDNYIRIGPPKKIGTDLASLTAFAECAIGYDIARVERREASVPTRAVKTARSCRFNAS